MRKLLPIRPRSTRALAPVAAVVAAGVTLAVGALLGGPGTPAQAAALGTITLDPPTRTVSFTPMVQTATTSAGCPDGFRTNARMFVRPAAGGTAGFLSSTVSGTATDLSVPFTVSATRSMQTALAGAPADGDYELFIECRNASSTPNPDVFSVTVTVTGGTWAVRNAPTGPPSPTPTSPSPTPTSPSPTPSSPSPTPGAPSPTPTSPGPTPSATVSATPSQTPSDTPSATPSQTPGETPSDSPSPTPGGTGGGDDDDDDLALTGTSLPIVAGSGLLLVALGVWAVLLTTRRRHELAASGDGSGQ